MREAQLQAPEGWKRAPGNGLGGHRGRPAEGGASLALCELMGRERLVPQAAHVSPEKGAFMEDSKYRAQPSPPPLLSPWR